MNRRTQISLIILIILQILTLQFWLTISAHSGQTTIAWMMTEGRVLFGDILEQHAPATSLIAAAAQMIVPFDAATTARLLNTLLMAAITLGVFHLATRYSGSGIAGLLAAAIWILLGPVYGNVLFYFNTLLVGFVIAGLMAWHRYEDSGRWGWLIVTGLAFGAATLAKQQGWALVAAFGLWLLLTRRSLPHIITYSLSALVLPAIVVALIAAQGNLDNYVYWNWTFNFSGYMDSVPLDSHFFRKLAFTNALVPAFALLAWRDRKPQFAIALLLYAALLIPLYPRFGESAAVTHIPFTALMSGIVLHRLWQSRETVTDRDLIAWGVIASVIVAWLWMGAVMYVPGAVRTPGWDEYTPLVERIESVAQPDDTLFVLPETDSTPQIHVRSGLLPPQTWIKGWRWYLEPPGVRDNLLAEWENTPPDFMVVFPDLLASGQPAIDPLLDFVEAGYQELERVEDIPLHGAAIIYQREER